MASRFYGVNQGQHHDDVVEGAATNSTAVEVAVDLSKSLSRDEVLRSLELIKQKIMEDSWPPA